jgi:hypothetical protein
MAMARKPLWIVLLSIPLAAVVLVVLLARRDEPRVVDLDPPVAPAVETAEPEPPRELLPPVEVRVEEGNATTTVLWPLKVELELVEARFLPQQEGVPPVGSGANARLSGQISDVNEQGVVAEIRFVAGANTGRVLKSDPEGRFGATDLYPGLSIVEVHGPGTLGSRREVRLRRGQETLLNIGYGRPGAVFGKVQDRTGTGIGGADVSVDGTHILTDDEGGFYLPTVAAGQVLVEVEKDGFALYQELVWIAGGSVTPADRLTFTLKPAVELRVAVRGNAGGPGPVLLYLLSDRKVYSANAAQRNESFPWHRINPVEVMPGTPVTIGKLPPEVIKVHAFRAGARAPVKPVNLAGDLRDIEINLEPAPTIVGRVLQDDAPVFGATVRLEAPDRVRATLGYFTEASYFLETAVLPNLPPGFQEVKTDREGRFTLSAWTDVSPVRYIEARAPGGGGWTGRFVQPDDSEVVLQLKEVDLGDAQLSFEFPGRHQGLPVELWIRGSPSPARVVPADQELEVRDLVAGLWRVRASWHGQTVLPDEEIVIEGSQTKEILLPPEAIEGQDEEAWRRAGRGDEYPGG